MVHLTFKLVDALIERLESFFERRGRIDTLNFALFLMGVCFLGLLIFGAFGGYLFVFYYVAERLHPGSGLRWGLPLSLGVLSIELLYYRRSHNF